MQAASSDATNFKEKLPHTAAHTVTSDSRDKPASKPERPVKRKEKEGKAAGCCYRQCYSGSLWSASPAGEASSACTRAAL